MPSERFCEPCMKKNFIIPGRVLKTAQCSVCGVTTFTRTGQRPKKLPTKFSNLKPKNPCSFCPCYRWPTVFGPTQYGDSASNILFVGEAPGERELQEGEQFVGRSGKLLRRFLRYSHITEFTLTNAARCSVGGGPREKPPTDAFKYCSLLLRAEIDELKPKVIVPLGGIAIEAIAGLFPETAFSMLGVSSNLAVGPLSGTAFQVGEHPIIWPMFHPAYFLKPGNEALAGLEYPKYKDLKRRCEVPDLPF